MADEEEEEGEGPWEANIIPFVPKRAGKPCRPRHDGFTPEKQKRFFKVLKKTGCLADACRAAGISRNTVRRWRDRWEAFDEKVETALALASVELDMIAWKRATEGTKETVWRDGRIVYVRQKQSDSMLRLLMQGADPERYGRMGQLPKKTVLKQLRKEAEREAKAGLSASHEELADKIVGLFGRLRRRRLAEGYNEGPDGRLVPPGWRMVPDADPPAAPDDPPAPD